MDPHLELAALDVKEGNHGSAITRLTTQLKGHADDVELRIALGRLLCQLKRFEEALVHYNVALGAAPNDARVQNGIKSVNSAMGSME